MHDSKLSPLCDAATDVLYALFFRGALLSGDLPSKLGANELRDAGLACAKHTATPFGGEDYFTYLTAKGQEFAIKYLAETRFGVAQKSENEAFIKKVKIQPASIAASAIEGEHARQAEAIAREAKERSEASSQSVWVPSRPIPSADESIEQRTLSVVLSSALHQVDAERAGDVAIKLAQAVKSAFQTLNSGFAAGGKMSQQWGVKMDSIVSLARVDQPKQVDQQPDAHDPVSLQDIKASREDDMLTFGDYPGAQLTGKVAFNAASSETRVIFSQDMKKAISDVVLNVIQEQSKPGGLLHRHSR
ncbi:hypothetical protein [Superficieibacter sp. 1612_C1]|uniref:hypothetical protein n=1 Tax=Superficieibacter sp. 1612_C1 TaxID=2780382 RepID=UPI001883DAA1|nr:hypothetical protein [Superficieibacter sp. 1612_C1]